MQQHRRSYGPALDIAFSTDKSNVSRTGPNPVHSRASSGTFVNQNGRIVGKTRSSTSLNPARISVGGVAVFEVPAGSIVGWLNGSVVVVMEDTDGDDQIGAQRHVTGTLIHKTDTALTLLVTSKVGTTTLSSWSVSYRGLRINHDPITGLCRGALIEQSKTNILEASERFDLTTVWTQIRLMATPTANTDTAPDGELTAERLIPSEVSGDHRIDDPTIPIVSGSTYTVSAFVKDAGYTGFGIHVGSSPIASATFSLIGSGSVVSVASGWTARIYPYKDGWYRCCATFTATTANRLYLFVGQNGTTFSYVGDTTSGIILWGVQCELGSETSYIPSNGVVTTIRSADIYNITGTAFSGMWNTNEGTIFASGDPSVTASAIGTYIMANSGANTNQVSIYRNSTTNFYGVANSGTYTANIQFASSNGSFNKIAGSYATNDARSAANGTLGTSDTTVIVPTNLTRLNIGSSVVSNSEFANGCISAIRCFRSPLSNSELQALTTTVSETITYNGVPILYNGEELLETS